MHSDLKRFGLEGTIDERYFSSFRSQREAEIVQQMREEGYVPIIGFGPFWATVYNFQKDNYDFILSVHGMYVGEEDACLISGITMEGIKLRIPNGKSNQSSTESA